MSYTVLQNSPIVVSLPQAAQYTGWEISGNIASHSSCQSGYIYLNYPVIAGGAYQLTYTILSITGGYVSASVGDTGGMHYTDPNIIVETITATNNGFIKLFSNATATLQLFNIKNLTVQDGVTIVYSTTNKKWSDTRTMYPQFGFSLFERSVLTRDGALWVQQNGSDSRNNFFGEQFQSSIKFAETKDSTMVKVFESLNYQANMLLVSTQEGIETDLGQASTLIDTDFLKETLTDGQTTVYLYSKNGIYSASFQNDETQDNGSPLTGSYVIVELQTVDGSTPLQLFTVDTKTAHLPQGER